MNNSPDLSFLIVRAFYDLRGLLDRLISEHGLEDKVKPGMGPILYALLESDGCPVRELCERVQLAPSTVTNTLKRMQKQGLVATKPDKNDRRSVRVSLTPGARKLEPELNALRESVRTSLRSNLTRAEEKQLVQLLTRAIRGMEAA